METGQNLDFLKFDFDKDIKKITRDGKSIPK